METSTLFPEICPNCGSEQTISLGRTVVNPDSKESEFITDLCECLNCEYEWNPNPDHPQVEA